MANFHPHDNQLAEYSAGSLDWAVGILISTHLSLCSECRRKVHELDCIGGALVSDAESVDLSANAFSDVMARIKSMGSDPINAQTIEPQPHIHSQGGSTHELCTSNENLQPASEITYSPTKSSTLDIEAGLKPEVSNNSVRKKALYSAAALDSIPPIVKKLLPVNRKIDWKKVSPHLEESQLKTNQDKYKVCLHKIKRGGRVVEHDHHGLEITVVLSGCFSDENGSYNAGDFIAYDAGQTHRPMASQDQDCVCLSLTAAPIKITGLLGKVVNPFLSFKPA